MEKYEKKVVKKIYKLLKNDITEFRFGMPNLFDLAFFNSDFEYSKLCSKGGEIQINFDKGTINAPIYIELKGKYKKKILDLILTYYHEKREEFALNQLNKVVNVSFNEMIENNSLDSLFTNDDDDNEEEDD